MIAAVVDTVCPDRPHGHGAEWEQLLARKGCVVPYRTLCTSVAPVRLTPARPRAVRLIPTTKTRSQAQLSEHADLVGRRQAIIDAGGTPKGEAPKPAEQTAKVWR